MYLTRTEVREVDRRAIENFGIPGIVLMENAGRGCAELLIRQGVQGQVVICCGKGNNGGDGYVMARHLDIHGIAVKVLLCGFRPEDLSGDAAVHCAIIRKIGLPLTVIAKDELSSQRLQSEFARSEWLVDALFGTGLEGAVRAPYDIVIETMNQSGLPIFAVDIPSGLDCDSGQPLGPTVRAKLTGTFVAQKKGFENPQTKQWTGEVQVLTIGVKP